MPWASPEICLLLAREKYRDRIAGFVVLSEDGGRCMAFRRSRCYEKRDHYEECGGGGRVFAHFRDIPCLRAHQRRVFVVLDRAAAVDAIGYSRYTETQRIALGALRRIGAIASGELASDAELGSSVKQVAAEAAASALLGRPGDKSCQLPDGVTLDATIIDFFVVKQTRELISWLKACGASVNENFVQPQRQELCICGHIAPKAACRALASPARGGEICYGDCADVDWRANNVLLVRGILEHILKEDGGAEFWRDGHSFAVTSGLCTQLHSKLGLDLSVDELRPHSTFDGLLSLVLSRAELKVADGDRKVSIDEPFWLDVLQMDEIMRSEFRDGFPHAPHFCDFSGLVDAIRSSVTRASAFGSGSHRLVAIANTARMADETDASSGVHWMTVTWEVKNSNIDDGDFPALCTNPECRLCSGAALASPSGGALASSAGASSSGKRKRPDGALAASAGVSSAGAKSSGKRKRADGDIEEVLDSDDDDSHVQETGHNRRTRSSTHEEAWAAASTYRRRKAAKCARLLSSSAWTPSDWSAVPPYTRRVSNYSKCISHLLARDPDQASDAYDERLLFKHQSPNGSVIPVQAAQRVCCNDGEWFDDACIEMFQRNYRAEHPDVTKRAVVVANFFYTRLVESGSYRFDLALNFLPLEEPGHFFDREVFPININHGNSHWGLVVVANLDQLKLPAPQRKHEPLIFYLDSSFIPYPHGYIAKNVRRFIGDMWTLAYPKQPRFDSPLGLVVPKGANITKQVNNCDCGVFLCLFWLMALERGRLGRTSDFSLRGDDAGRALVRSGLTTHIACRSLRRQLRDWLTARAIEYARRWLDGDVPSPSPSQQSAADKGRESGGLRAPQTSEEEDQKHDRCRTTGASAAAQAAMERERLEEAAVIREREQREGATHNQCALLSAVRSLHALRTDGGGQSAMSRAEQEKFVLENHASDDDNGNGSGLSDHRST